MFTWLSDNNWNNGSRLKTDDFVKQATEQTLNAGHFK
ncbi:hypothetical protein GL178_12450 [Vibrio toranzoniae]|nr:hypothetical protein [Vibrio toranzoniae]